MKNTYKILFLSTMVTGTLIAISSTSWLISWIGLEINLLSMMPLMKSFKNTYSSESAIKYFITQAMASSLLLFAVISYTATKSSDFELNFLTSTMISGALMLKLGAAPFHFWLPEVISGVNWPMAFIILTWQKIAPMILITYTTQITEFLIMFIVASSLISGIQSFNQTCLRKIMAYSSINHMSWMLTTLMTSMSIWFLYLLIYTIINLNIFIILKKYNINKISQLTKVFNKNKKIKFFFMMNFLSLGGLPPFFGFLPKWLAINNLVSTKFYILSFMLIITTLISLYIYLRLTFPTKSLSAQESLLKTFNSINFIHLMINLIFLLGLLMYPLISYMY